MEHEIDFNKLKKGDIILVKNSDGNYHACDITGINQKHQTITCDVGDYATYYNVPLCDCKPYFASTYQTTYLKEESMKKIDLVDVEVGDNKLDLTRIREAKKYTIYDLVLEDMQEMESIPYMKDILSVKSNQNMWGRIRKLIERAKIEHELVELYRRTQSPHTQNSIVIEKINKLEKELEALK